MQNRWVPFFVNRSIYYASKAIVGQRKKTIEQKPALYQLMPVYVVCLMNFMPKDNAVSKFRTDVALYEKGSQDVFSDNLRFIYLSLPFFDKKAEECESDFDKWIYVLKHMEALERMPFTAQKKIFKRLAELADSRCLSQEEQEKYDESLKAADDYYGVLMSYYMNGIDEGEAKGFAKGEAKGFAKGEAKGSYHKSLDEEENAFMYNTGFADWVYASISTQKLIEKTDFLINAEYGTSFMFFKLKQNEDEKDSVLFSGIVALPWHSQCTE